MQREYKTHTRRRAKLFCNKVCPQEEGLSRQSFPNVHKQKWAQNSLAKTPPNQKKRKPQKPLLPNPFLTPTFITNFHINALSFPRHLLMSLALLSRFLESIHHVLDSPKLQPSQSFPSSPSSPIKMHI